MKSIYHIHKNTEDGKYYLHINDDSEVPIELPTDPPPAAPYLKYVAIMEQSGTDAPVATILENTIGAIVWTRASTGSYRGTLAGAFLEGKVVIFTNPDWNNTNAFVSNASRINDDRIDYGTYDGGSAGIAIALTDGGIIHIEIRVYP